MWELGEATYSETHLSFEEVALGISEWLSAIETQGLSDGDGAVGLELAQAIDTLEAAAIEVIEGLEVPDTGQARAEAVGAWLAAVSGFDSLVTGLTPISTSSTTIAAPTTTAVEVAATSTTIPIAADDGTHSDGNGGWILLVVAVGGMAYWLGKRRGPSR